MTALIFSSTLKSCLDKDTIKTKSLDGFVSFISCSIGKIADRLKKISIRQNGPPSGLENRGLDTCYCKTRKPTD
ncbi:hypothetical protein [Leptospira interrogans]|uniref:hypothetical protein n=1 Tax=Leptospira interrogans TaxID=173 RepID=UPI0002BBC94E|nr:hypothetical protein [Leptospira interrogans]MCR8646245.1 hypothetical protein [Leptospira interrogans serovar Bataviae]QOI37953.1 hypothetical protein Lepto1548_06420 [Leptospira interrogans serovar Bataviae]QYY61522.1 hypothetical protein GR153_005980 [Leptospira interrogans serovar Bataviae]